MNKTLRNASFSASITNHFAALQQQIATLTNRLENVAQSPIYTNKQMMAMLDINPKLIKKYRDEGLLGFSQVNDKFFYSSSDLDEFLQHNYNSAFAYSNCSGR
ncbi:MAG: helix-turn-helix domain-containing protein [Dysgonamonadaceae bacterium]|jgi:hypothetical protein|nr:helix-turn-helix domain-containing protein [Dysgonamonadaceae bacterium]